MTRQTAMSIPGRPKSGPSFGTSCKHRVPTNKVDQAIAGELSRQFRAGAIYAYDGGTWTTWGSQADWDATERTSPTGRVIRDQAARDARAGPYNWDRDGLARSLVIDTTPAKRPGKAAYVEMLRRIRDGVDWSVDELDQLLAVA